MIESTSSTAELPRLFLGNFDFEHQLADPGKPLTSKILRQLNADLATSWLLIGRPSDAIWTPEPIDSQFFSSCAEKGLSTVWPVPDLRAVASPFELCPWGWSADVLHWGEQHGVACQPPPLAAVRQANCRTFSLELEQEWVVGLDGAALVRSVEELHSALSGFSTASPWVLKSRFGMSGRERVLGRGNTPSLPTLNWLRQRLARDTAVVFEPWVDKIAEVGIQFSIPRAGPPEFLGVTPLLTDASGGYRGNRFGLAATHDDWQAAIDVCRRAVERIQALGYFGPVGIDAMRYRNHAGDTCVRPLQDINARYTMGRLALGLNRLRQPSEVGAWLHFRRPVEMVRNDVDCLDQILAKLPKGARLIPTSPPIIGDRLAARGSAALFANSIEQLAEVEQLFEAQR